MHQIPSCVFWKCVHPAFMQMSPNQTYLRLFTTLRDTGMRWLNGWMGGMSLTSQRCRGTNKDLKSISLSPYRCDLISLPPASDIQSCSSVFLETWWVGADNVNLLFTYIAKKGRRQIVGLQWGLGSAGLQLNIICHHLWILYITK